MENHFLIKMRFENFFLLRWRNKKGEEEIEISLKMSFSQFIDSNLVG